MKQYFAPLAAAIILQGCNATLPTDVPPGPPTNVPTTSSQVATGLQDASLIASAIAADSPALAQLSGANAATINGYASAVASGFAAMSQATTAAAQGSAMQVIEANANALIQQAASAPGIPASVQSDLQAIEVLLPVAEVAFGVVQSLQAAAPVPLSMTVDQARNQLARHQLSRG